MVRYPPVRPQPAGLKFYLLDELRPQTGASAGENKATSKSHSVVTAPVSFGGDAP